MTKLYDKTYDVEIGSCRW